MEELRGMPVVNAMAEALSRDIAQLGQRGIVPKLAVVRVGEKEDDLAYEKGIKKRFSAMNAAVDIFALPEDVSQGALEQAVRNLNDDKAVHGILIFRPLPKHLSEDAVRSLIAPGKDVDGMSLMNAARVFAGSRDCFPPCTPQAVLELLDHYQIDVTGKKVTVVGRSLVVGKPLAMLLLGRNATVTVCHTKTQNLAEECRRADVLIACAGAAKMVTAGFTHPEQVIIDVGINMLDGKLCGDVDYAAVAEKARAITPVPGGVGTITTSVLLKHTVQSASRTV